MKINYILFFIAFTLCYFSLEAQDIQPSTKEVLEQSELLRSRNQLDEAIGLLDEGIHTAADAPTDLAYLYAHKSGIYAAIDSLLIAKRLADLSMANAEESKQGTALAAAFRAKAFLENIMNMPDAVVKDALEGLKQVEKNKEDPLTKYYLNYLLYGAYSKWDDGEKMEKYIRIAQEYAVEAEDVNLQVNASNGISSMYLARYRKKAEKSLLDSSYHYLDRSFSLQQKYPQKITGNTFVITCINLADYYLDYSTEALQEREQKASYYLQLAEDKLAIQEASAEKWVNVFGIRSGFAKQKGNLSEAEGYLHQGLGFLANAKRSYYKLEYRVNSELADIALEKGDLKAVVGYQQQMEKLLKKSFDEQHLFNVQKLEVQYETQKKEQELQLSKEREKMRITQNYLYGGIALALLLALVGMMVSYHFKLRYAIEREKKIVQEKEDAQLKADMQIRLEKEEQARLKAEQELLELRRQQLEKEALANSLIIERKNDTLRQIQDQIRNGEAHHIQKLLKEEMMMQANFETIKMQLQELHPDFFQRLNEKAVQKLTSLDLKYCTYIYLKMTVKEIAQTLHVEPQSVRMFKYRLKQKFDLGKDISLEDYLADE